MFELIDFFAEWCGPCQVMGPIVEEIETAYEGKISVKRVDVEVDSDAAAKYGVMSIPTFVLLKDGDEVDRKMGAMPKDMFTQWIETHLG